MSAYTERQATLRRLTISLFILLVLAIQLTHDHFDNGANFERLERLSAVYALLVAAPDDDVILRDIDPQYEAEPDWRTAFEGGSLFEGLFRIDPQNIFEIGGSVRHPSGASVEFIKLKATHAVAQDRLDYVASLYDGLGLDRPGFFPMMVRDELFIVASTVPEFDGIQYKSRIHWVTYGLSLWDFPIDAWEIGNEIQSIAQGFGVFEDDPRLSFRKVSQLWSTQSVSIPVIDTKVSAKSAGLIIFVLASIIGVIIAGQLRLMIQLAHNEESSHWALLDSPVHATDGMLSRLSWFVERTVGIIFYWSSPLIPISIGVLALVAVVPASADAGTFWMVVSLLFVDGVVMSGTYLLFVKLRLAHP